MTPALRNSLLVALAVAALAAGYTTSQWFFRPQVEAPEAALVDFSLPDPDGKARWLSDWQGKTIVLNFWATWCDPCREEIPLLIKIQKRYKDRGVQVVGVAIDHREAVVAYAKTTRFNYPLLLGEDAGLSIMARFGNPRGSLPFTVIISSDGVIAARKVGAYKELQLEEVLMALVKPAAQANLTYLAQ